MPKNAEKFICEECDFKCCNIKYYYRYLFTRTYNMLTNAYLRLLKCLPPKIIMKIKNNKYPFYKLVKKYW